MGLLRRVTSFVRRVLQGWVWGAMPGGPGRIDMGADMHELEARRRREQEIWRQGTEDEPKGPPRR